MSPSRRLDADLTTQPIFRQFCSLLILSTLAASCSVASTPTTSTLGALFDEESATAPETRSTPRARFVEGQSVVSAARHPRGALALTVSTGDFSAPTSDRSDLETGAVRYKLSFEAGGSMIGGGMNLEVLTVDDDLESQINASIASTDTLGVQAFGHLTIRPSFGDDCRMPIRIGAYVDSLSGDTNGVLAVSNTTLDYLTVGLRLEMETEYDVYASQDMTLSVFVGGRISYGITDLDYATSVDQESFDTTASDLGFFSGIRVRAQGFHFETGYVHDTTTYEQSDPEFFGGILQPVNEAEFGFSGLTISMGLRW